MKNTNSITNSGFMREYLVLKDPISYEDALKIQKEKSLAKKSGWMFFCTPPVFTTGYFSNQANKYLLNPSLIERSRIPILNTTRGGKITYHGPEQILGFPIGALKDHIGDSRSIKKWISSFQRLLARYLKSKFDLDSQKPSCLSGIWIEQDSQIKKIVSVGIKASKLHFEHGFALNLFESKPFEWIYPCGEPTEKIGYLFKKIDPRIWQEHAEQVCQLFDQFFSQGENNLQAEFVALKDQPKSEQSHQLF